MDTATDNRTLDLALVMPVYNEQECIEAVVKSWYAMLEQTVPEFRMIVINDGSRDATEAALAGLGHLTRLQVINKPNSGHGPTILKGYWLAVREAHWVFQCDSDDELPPDAFPRLWQQREQYDFLFGTRGGRVQNTGRLIITRGSRLAVRLLFGPGVRDVNTPYRLMRADLLADILTKIPPDAFAPNVIISGLAARRGHRFYHTEVEHRGRRTGTVSIIKWKLWKSVFKALGDTLKVALKK